MHKQSAIVHNTSEKAALNILGRWPNLLGGVQRTKV